MTRPIATGSLVAFAVGSILAQAQAVAEETKGNLEEITVTAERREASLQTVPVPVTAITTEELEKRQVTEAKDLARYAPSLKMFNNITTPTNLSPSLRGSLQQDASLIVAESPFGIYVDDVYMARLNGNNVTLADIERVEVLRGPQGTLYGRNTLAGAVKFVTRTPGDKAWLNASFGGGNFGQQRYSFSLGAPMGAGWAGSLSAQYSRLGPQFYNRDPSVNAATGEEQNWAARGKLRYTGIDNLDVVFSASTSQANNDSGQLIPGTTPNVPSNRQFTSDDIKPTYGVYTLSTPNVARATGIANQPFEDLKQSMLSLNIAYKLGGGMTLKSITGYVNTKDSFTTDFTGSGAIIAGSRSGVDQISQEFQISGVAMNDALNYLAGVYYFKEQGSQLFVWQIGSPFSRSLIDMKTESYSAFFQGDYKVTDALKVTLGLRYTQDKKDFDMLFQGLLLPGIVTPARGVVDLNNKYTKTTPRFGIDYTLPASGSVDSMLLYGSVAQGFKSGGYSAIAIANFNDARTPYGPESNTTYEAGIKTDLFGRTLRINANYFYAKINELTLNATVPGNPPSFPVQNSGKATVQGLEYEVTYAPTSNLTTYLSGTLFGNGKYNSLNPTSSPAQAPTAYGVQPVVPQVPDWSVTVGFDYGFDVGPGRLSFGADWFQTADYITSATNDFKVKGYGVGNAYVDYKLGDNWSTRASVKNFSDENTITTGSRALGGFIPLRPRTWMLSFNYNLR